MFSLTFLGTSAGVPTLRRNVTALAIRTGQRKAWVLVDCGEATQHQLLKTRLSVHDLQAICITHAHGDHCYGLPGILASAAMHGRTAPLTLAAPQSVLDWVQATITLTTLYLPYPLETVAIEPRVQQKGGLCIAQQWTEGSCTHTLEIHAHPLRHRVPSYGYTLQRNSHSQQLDKTRLNALGVAAGPAWGKLQRGEPIVLDNGDTLHSADVTIHGQTQLRMVVGGDNADMNCLQNACADAQLLVHEATYTKDIWEKAGNAPMHSCAHDVAAFAERMQLPNLILTHISPRYNTGEAETQLLDEARQVYSGNLHLARDFAQFSLAASGLKQL